MIDVSEFEDRTSIAHAALRFLQENGITVPKPIKMVATRSKETTKEKSKIFGVALADIEERDDVLLNDHISCDVPHFLAECLNYLAEFVTVEGLFRKAGSVARQRDIKATMEFGGVFPDGRPHDVASLLKLFLRELPEPLLTRRFSKVFCDCTITSTAQDLGVVACLLLPLHHLQCLQVLMQFLRRLSTQSQANKMDLHSLAVVMTPNLFQLTIPDSVADSQLNLTAYTTAVEYLISHAEEIGSVPKDVATRAVQLSKEFDGNLPPLLLTFNGGHEATDYETRRSMRRIRRKSASFSDLMKGLSSSISRLRKASPKKSSLYQVTGSSSGAGSDITVTRKESVKRRAEYTSAGTKAKRRAVHQSPDDTPTSTPSSKKGKRRSGLFRRKAIVEKGRHKGKSRAIHSPCHVLAHSPTDSDDQLIISPTEGSSDGVTVLDIAVPTSTSSQSVDEVDTDLNGSCNATNKESQFGRIDFGNGYSTATTPSLPKYSYQVVTSDGTLVKCLSRAEKLSSSTLKFSEVQRKRAVSASTDTLASDAQDGVTCLSHDRLEAEFTQSCEGVSTPLLCKSASSFHGNKGLGQSTSRYQLRSSNLARQAAILPSKMRVVPTPTSKLRPAAAPTPTTSQLIGKSRSDGNIRGKSVASNRVQGYDFTPFIMASSSDEHMATSVDATPRFIGGQLAEKQLLSSAAVASRKRRSIGNSIRRVPSAVRPYCEPLLPTISADQAKLDKSSIRRGRRSLDSAVIASSSKGFSPSRDYHFSVPDRRRRNSPSIGSHIGNQEDVSERSALGGFHFSAPQALGGKQGTERVTSENVPVPKSNSKYRKLECEPFGLLPSKPSGQPCSLKDAVSPNLLEQISLEILERRKSDDRSALEDDFLLKCTNEEKKKGSPSARKIPGSHSRRSSSYRLALQPPTAKSEPRNHFDDVALSNQGPSVAVGDHPLVERPQKSDDHLLLTIHTSVPLPRRRASKMADAETATKCSEKYVMPVSSSRRGLGKSTPKMTGSSSSPIGYVKSQVKKFSEQFFQSPVTSSGTVHREPLKTVNSHHRMTSSTVTKNRIHQVSKEWLV